MLKGIAVPIVSTWHTYDLRSGRFKNPIIYSDYGNMFAIGIFNSGKALFCAAWNQNNTVHLIVYHFQNVLTLLFQTSVGIINANFNAGNSSVSIGLIDQFFHSFSVDQLCGWKAYSDDLYIRAILCPNLVLC